MSEVKVKFEVEKETQGTFRFKEADVVPGDKPILGTLYVPKPTLRQMDWHNGDDIIVTLNVG